MLCVCVCLHMENSWKQKHKKLLTVVASGMEVRICEEGRSSIFHCNDFDLHDFYYVHFLIKNILK